MSRFRLVAGFGKGQGLAVIVVCKGLLDGSGLSGFRGVRVVRVEVIMWDAVGSKSSRGSGFGSLGSGLGSLGSGLGTGLSVVGPCHPSYLERFLFGLKAMLTLGLGVRLLESGS